jgi:DNA-binding CsgD family transcriptional regulator
VATTDQDLHVGEILRQISSSSSIAEILEMVRSVVVKLGANRTSYHLTPKLRSQTDRRIHLATSGFSDKWLRLYEEADFRKHDPIPDIIMRHGEPMLWQDALASKRLNEGEEEFVRQLEAHGLHNGIGIPLFGPKGRDAYSAFTFEPEKLMYDDKTIAMVSAIAGMAHVRICNILEKEHAHNVQLSDRETQVIQLIANGRSNKAIASDLSIGGSTADTYVRRIFAKLDVSDRIGASIRALELGILRL